MKLKSCNVQVSCNSLKEAKIIGNSALKIRLAACYEIYSGVVAKYFWPPKVNKLQSETRCTLILSTLPPAVKKLQKLIKLKHSDQVPFIGLVEITNLNSGYYHWLKQELK
ncbi:MAG: divalent cation tolerance protein CutA [Patescibacteria group bacterium]